MNASTRTHGAICLIFGLAVSTCLGAGEMVGKPWRTGDEPRVDNWVDAWMLAHSGPAGQAVDGKYSRRHDLLDTTDAKQGLFAVRFTVGKKTRDNAFGFSAGPYLKHWALAGDFTLHAWVKASATSDPDRWRIALYDAAGHKAETDLAGMAADGRWREYAWPLASLQSKDGFDARTIRAVQVEAALPQRASLWLDNVFFQRDKEFLGVSDKTITQYMAEAAATRPCRVAETMSNPGSWYSFGLTAPLYKGDSLEAANKAVIEWTKPIDGGPNGKWTLLANSTANWLLFGFGSKGRIAPGRLTPEAERACSIITGSTAK